MMKTNTKVLDGAKRGNSITTSNAKKVRDKYYANPKICAKIGCNGVIPFRKRNHQRFCSLKCSNSKRQQ